MERPMSEKPDTAATGRTTIKNNNPQKKRDSQNKQDNWNCSANQIGWETLHSTGNSPRRTATAKITPTNPKTKNGITLQTNTEQTTTNWARKTKTEYWTHLKRMQRWNQTPITITDFDSKRSYPPTNYYTREIRWMVTGDSIKLIAVDMLNWRDHSNGHLSRNLLNFSITKNIILYLPFQGNPRNFHGQLDPKLQKFFHVF